MVNCDLWGMLPQVLKVKIPILFFFREHSNFLLIQILIF